MPTLDLQQRHVQLGGERPPHLPGMQSVAMDVMMALQFLSGGGRRARSEKHFSAWVVALVFSAASSLIAFVPFVGSFWEQLVSRWYQTTYILVPYGVRYFLVPNKPPRSF